MGVKRGYILDLSVQNNCTEVAARGFKFSHWEWIVSEPALLSLLLHPESMALQVRPGLSCSGPSIRGPPSGREPAGTLLSLHVYAGHLRNVLHVIFKIFFSFTAEHSQGWGEGVPSFIFLRG